MTFEEYDVKISEMGERLKANWSEELYKEVSEFQYEHMDQFFNDYHKTVNDDPAKWVCNDLLHYAIYESSSGNAIEYVDTEKEVDAVERIIMDEIGKYLLEPPKILYTEDGRWAIDCMFGGNYVPYWDGWRD